MDRSKLRKPHIFNQACYWLSLILLFGLSNAFATIASITEPGTTDNSSTDINGVPLNPGHENDLILNWDASQQYGECQILISDDSGNIVYSSFTFWESGQFNVSHPDKILNAGDAYTFRLISKHDIQLPVASQSFTFWPECNPVTEIKVIKQLGGDVLVTWIDPDPSTPGTYHIKYSLDGAFESSNVLDAGKSTSLVLNSLGWDGQLSISVQKRCHYENGVSIVGRWTPGPTVVFEKSPDRSVDCSTLQYTYTCSNISDSSVTVSVNGPIPGSSGDGPWYRVRYRIKNTQTWDVAHLISGSSIVVKGLAEGTTYEISVQASVGYDPYYPTEECENMPASQEITTTGDQTWNDVYCGVDPETSFNSADPKTNWGNDEVVYIFGFPLKAVAVTHLGNGFYSGTGLVGVPFASKHVEVEFDSIYVNINYEVEVGEVVLINDSSKEQEIQLLINQLPTSEFDCTPPQEDPYEFDPVTGLNNFGFDSSGVYKKIPPYPGWEEGMPFDSLLDPNGFDATGIHFKTGTIFGPNGCSQGGIDSLGNPCNPKGPVPYYWLYQSFGDPTNEGKEFWDTQSPQIDSAIILAIESFWSDASDSIAEVGTRCGSIRSSMESIVTAKQLDSNFLFGDSLEYIQVGLHRHFAKEPNRYSNFSGRDPDIMDLEDKHFDLFHCDRYLYQFKEMEEMLDSILNAVSPSNYLPAFRIIIEPVILGMDSAQIAQNIGTPEKLRSFIAVLVIKKLIEDYKVKYGYSFSSNSSFQDSNRNVCRINSSPNINPLIRHSSSGVGCSIDNGFEKFYLPIYSTVENLSTSHDYKKTFDKISINTILSGSSGEKGPIALTKDIGSNSHTIYLDNIRIRPDEALVDALFILEVQSGKPILFSADDISFNKGGLVAGGKLILLNNTGISMGKAIKINLIGDQGNTFVAWGCEGVDSISIDAQLEFCREYVVPLDSVTLLPVPGSETVKADIAVTLQSWDDLLFHINVPAFALTGREEYKFKLLNTWVDFSDLGNPVNIVYPEHYDHPQLGNNTWQGVYFQELSVTMPSYMAHKDSSDLTLGLYDFVFDDFGASGRVAVSPVLSLLNGTIGGWAFSIDSIDLEISHNRFAEGYMGGLVNVPLFRSTTSNSESVKPKDCFSYFAKIDAFGNFMFKVSPNSDFTIPMVFAEVTLTSATSVMMRKTNNEFEIVAVLHGDIVIDTTFAGIPLHLGQITFENVILSNKGAAVRNIGYWEFPGFQVDFSGFKLNFEKIGIRQSPTNEESIELLFNTSMSLTAGSVDLKVGFDFGIEGLLDKSNTHYKWKYDDFNLYRASISGSCPGIDYILGELIMYKNDATYGNGFQGAVAVKFSKMELQIQAMGIFGRIEDGESNESYKYGMVDAMVVLPGPGIPIISPVNLNGIGGGFWYNMQSTDHENVQLSNQFQDSLSTDFVASQSLGFSLSGVQYVPDKGDWGFKITVAFIVGNENAANGNATIGISFTDDKGIDEFYVEGNIQFMNALNISGLSTFEENSTSDPDSLGLCAGAPIRAFVRMKMDFTNGAFDSDFEAFLSVGSVLKGSGAGNAFCKVKIHIDADDWYLWFGEPKNRAGLIVTIPGNLGNIKFTTYFNMGSKLPEPALLDKKLAQFFGVQPGFTPNHQFSTGKGFMHGSTFEIDSPEKKLWILTFSANLTVGYDLALTQYNAVCQYNNEKPGFNGWYASGQLYVYMAVNLGYDFKMFFKTYKGTIVGIEAGVLFRTQLPNPVWAQGVVKANYNILGILKGTTKFNVELGQKCVLIGENGDEYEVDLEIINYMDPGDGLASVAVNSSPTVYFNYPIDTKINIADPNGTPIIYEFKIDRIEWSDSLNLIVSHSKLWNEAKTEVLLTPQEFLRPNMSYKVKVLASAYVDGVFDQADTLIVWWVTGDRPDEIPPENVIESYPHVDQHYFLPGDRDASHCYVKLASGQYYLFAERPSNARNIIRVTDFLTKEVVYETNLLYNCKEAQLNWTIDWSSFVQPETTYRLECLQVRKQLTPPEEGISSGFNIGVGSRSIPGGYKGVGWPIQGPIGSGIPICQQFENDILDTLVFEKKFFEYKFSTSEYSTAEEKFEALLDSMILVSGGSNNPYFYSVPGTEGFDDYELNGHNGLPPFISMKILMDQSEWISPFENFLSVRTNGGARDCSDHILLLSDSYRLIENPLVESLSWSTGFVDTFSFENNVYNDVQLVNYLPSLLHHDLTSLKQSYISHLLVECGVENPNGLGNKMPLDGWDGCKSLHYSSTSEWVEISNRMENNNIKVIVDSPTKIQVEYNCKPSTNKGMGIYYFDLNY